MEQRESEPVIMKKYPVILVFVLWSAAADAARKVPGRIVFENATVDVTLLIPAQFFAKRTSTESLQKSVKYIDSKGKKHKLRPGQAKEFQFTHNGEEFRMVSRRYSTSLFPSDLFLRLLVDGPVKLFEHMETESGHTMADGNSTHESTKESFLLQRGEEPLYEVRFLGFRREMGKYFSDCAELVRLIESKELRRGDMEEIVRFYNERCRS